MSSKKPTKAELVAELAQVIQERDDACIDLEVARRTLAEHQVRNQAASTASRRLPPRIVELQREVTPQGDVLRVGEAVYQAEITPRADGIGYTVVAPIPNRRPLRTSLSPAGVGHLPEHVILQLVRA